MAQQSVDCGSTPSSKDRNIDGSKELLDEIKRQLGEDRLPQTAFNNKQIFDLEQERIFNRDWLYVGHESEIPNPGDYASRNLGENPFIFIRDEEGEIRVLFNSCRHRGTKLCESDQGNASHFRCPFHGWTYKNNGDLIGVPQKHEAFPDIEPDEWSMVSAPRVDSYGGLVFASLAEEGPSLDEYLGGLQWYLDLSLKLGDGGMEVIGEPHRYEVNMDWKMRSEGGRGDSYHTAFTHRSIIEADIADVGSGDEVEDITENTEYVRKVNLGRHAASLKLSAPQFDLYFDHPKEYLNPEAHLSEDQHDVARRSFVNTYGIFPNVSILHLSLKTEPDAPNRGVMLLRQWQPKAPGKSEMIVWMFAPKNAPDEYKDAVRKAGMTAFTPAGNFEQDDVAVWSRAVESAGSSFARLNNLSLNYEMGSDDMTEPVDDGLNTEEWPGTVYHGALTDAFMRPYYEYWQEQLSTPL